MAPLDGVDATSAIAAISELRVHAPHNDAIEERFWQQQQSQARARNDKSAAEKADAEHGSPYADTSAPTVISQADTLELGVEEALENPFASLIEHQMHLQLPPETDV